MSTVWKVLVGLALVVPVGAYVAGSIAASASDDPAPRHTITIRESDPGTTQSPSPSRPAERSDEVEVITPGYDDLDDHGGDDHGHGADDPAGHVRHTSHQTTGSSSSAAEHRSRTRDRHRHRHGGRHHRNDDRVSGHRRGRGTDDGPNHV